MTQPPLTGASVHRRATLLLTVAAVVSVAVYGCDGDQVQSPLIPRVKAMRPRATYVKESGVIELPVPAQSYPGDGGTDWIPSGVIIPAGNKFIRWHLTVPSITRASPCTGAMPEGPLNPGGTGGPNLYGATLVDLRYPGFPADSNTIGFTADPGGGGYTAIQENGGGFMPAAKRVRLNGSSCTIVDTTQIDPVTGAPGELGPFPAYNFSGSHRLEFETIEASISAAPDTRIFVGDSITFSLSLESVVPVDSIRWQFLYWPKKSLPAIPAPACDNQRTCSFKPTTSGGRATAKVYWFGGEMFIQSQEIYAFNHCTSDPTLAVDPLLNSAAMRTALMQLLDSAWADSAAGKRKERQVYFYRTTTDHSVPPAVFAFWEGVDSVPPTPCNSSFARRVPGPDWVLIGYAHAHPFTPGETKPPECGPLHAGRPYVQGPSTYDYNGQAPLQVPGYAIDKKGVNRYSRKPSYFNKVYDWNSSSCKW